MSIFLTNRNKSLFGRPIELDNAFWLPEKYSSTLLNAAVYIQASFWKAPAYLEPLEIMLCRAQKKIEVSDERLGKTPPLTQE